MPELPDIELYRVRLEERIAGRAIRHVRTYNPFVLRTVSPVPAALEGARAEQVLRVGKRVAITTDRGLSLVFHLMIAGRFDWRNKPLTTRPIGKVIVASVEFESGTLTLQEAAKQKRASLHLLEGDPRALDPGGAEPYEICAEAFRSLLAGDGRTVKRLLTDPRTLSGIGNAYSDEILHAARLSPIQIASKLSDEEAERLHDRMVSVLRKWEAKLQEEFPGFPSPAQITAFRPDFSVHGRFGLPCPDCGHKIQRIVRGEHETNYCAFCQTGGKILADRSLSRLLKDAWPRTLEEMEGG